MSRSNLPLTFLFILVTLIFAQNMGGQWAAHATSVAYLEVRVAPDRQVYQVGEDIFLALWVSTSVDEAYLSVRGPSGSFSDRIYVTGESYLTYKVGTAEEQDIGTWHVTFEACFYIPVYDYDGEDHHGDGVYYMPYCDADYASFDIVPGPAPDLVMTLTPDKSTVPVGDPLNVDVNLKNEGDGDALNIQVSHSSESFELAPGGLRPGSLNVSSCESLAPGESCELNFNFKAVGPTGEGNITFTASYVDEKGKQYDRVETMTLNITIGFQFVISNLYETESFNDYFTKLHESPYPFQNEFEVTLLGAEEIDSVHLIMSGLAEDKILLENIGGTKYRAKIMPPDRFSESNMKDLDWLILSEMAKYKGVELPAPNWEWKQPTIPIVRVEEMVVVLKDGTEIRKEVRRQLPNIKDILQVNLPRWTESGTIIVAMSKEEKPPADIMVTNPEGLKVGANYEEKKFTNLLNEVIGSLYSGRDTGLQLVRLPASPGEYRIKANGKNSGVLDLMILSLSGDQGNVRLRRSINIDEGQSLEFKTTISEEGMVEEVEDVGLFSWFKLEQFWPILIIPIVVIVLIFLIMRMRSKTLRVRRMPQKVPPPTMPEEIPE
ncbi:hypothetical protein [[Eubacterium] cellulosolvens]